jgi:hypothetical protein
MEAWRRGPRPMPRITTLTAGVGWHPRRTVWPRVLGHGLVLARFNKSPNPSPPWGPSGPCRQLLAITVRAIVGGPRLVSTGRSRRSLGADSQPTLDVPLDVAERWARVSCRRRTSGTSYDMGQPAERSRARLT